MACGTGGSCANIPGGFICTCLPGYERTAPFLTQPDCQPLNDGIAFETALTAVGNTPVASLLAALTCYYTVSHKAIAFNVPSGDPLVLTYRIRTTPPNADETQDQLIALIDDANALNACLASEGIANTVLSHSEAYYISGVPSTTTTTTTTSTSTTTTSTTTTTTQSCLTVTNGDFLAEAPVADGDAVTVGWNSTQLRYFNFDSSGIATVGLFPSASLVDAVATQTLCAEFMANASYTLAFTLARNVSLTYDSSLTVDLRSTLGVSRATRTLALSDFLGAATVTVEVVLAVPSGAGNTGEPIELYLSASGTTGSFGFTNLSLTMT